MSEKEKRIRSITRIYYSNPKVIEAMFNFAKDREVVPRYFEGFGKRPDTLQYPSDIMGLVNKGATSFHSSEELWDNPLEINPDMAASEISSIRKAWDLLIDIDSPFLDYSKIATKLIVQELEKQGVNGYGIKFSGSKGFHIIVPAKAFPEEFQELKTKDMFPEWPRAVCEYLMYQIRRKYNKEASKMSINFQALKERTNLSKEDVTTTICPNCKKSAEKGRVVTYRCPECHTRIERKNNKVTKRKLVCIQDNCPGFLENLGEEEFFYCKHCKTSSLSLEHISSKKVTYTREAKDSKYYSSEEFEEEIEAKKLADLDLVLVAPRHLFRMPYSLHEKTSLASIVLSKEEIDNFSPKDANPLKVKVKNFYPDPKGNEAKKLLESAVTWKAEQEEQSERELGARYKDYKGKKFEKIDVQGVPDELFPRPIKKLLKGLKEGRKRGFFVLLTFLRSLNFTPKEINEKVREWNKKNDPPLKEGYIRSQIDWHLKQKRQILPPNYSNANFYKDLNLFTSDSMPRAKNPISEVLRKVRELKNE